MYIRIPSDRNSLSSAKVAKFTHTEGFVFRVPTKQLAAAEERALDFEGRWQQLVERLKYSTPQTPQ
jgi:hypothetical protein